MSILNSFKALRSLRKTPAMYDLLLHRVTQEQATTMTDGVDGWNVVFILCHVRDYEGIYTERIKAALEHNNPQLSQPANNDELAVQNNYAGQDIGAVLESFKERRRALIALLEGLDDGQWLRRATMSNSGESTVLEWAINIALHDIDHLEQIARTLKK